MINGDKKVEWPKLLFPIFGLAFTALHKMTPDCEKKIPAAACGLTCTAQIIVCGKNGGVDI